MHSNKIAIRIWILTQEKFLAFFIWLKNYTNCENNEYVMNNKSTLVIFISCLPLPQIILSLRHSKVLTWYIFSLVILLTKMKSKLFLLVKNSMDLSQFFNPILLPCWAVAKAVKFHSHVRPFCWLIASFIGQQKLHWAIQNPMQSEIQFLSLEPSLYDP